jgi:transcriptional regulator with XRE-family HTH domain
MEITNKKHTTLGSLLRELRESKNLMQREVGALIDVDGAFISKIEHNDKTINRSHLYKLSTFFNVSVDELQTFWLADKIRALVKDEANAAKALNQVLNEIAKK